MLNWLSKFWLIALVFSSQISNCWACPMLWPPELLRYGQDALFVSPESAFDEEISLILPQIEISEYLKDISETNSNTISIREREVNDLRDYYENQEKTRGDAEVFDILSEYDNLRWVIDRKFSNVNSNYCVDNKDRDDPECSVSDFRIPEGLPEEFDLYIRGVIAFRFGKLSDACEMWERLLALPEEKRLYQTNSAAYMMGNIVKKNDPKKAIAYYRTVIEHSKKWGDDGSYGLASFHKISSCLLSTKKVAAIKDYLQLFKIGYPKVNHKSLRKVARYCLMTSSRDELRKLLGDDISRQMLIAYVVSISYGYQGYAIPENIQEVIAKVMENLECVPKSNIRGADKISLAAYQAGDMESAYKWLQLADDDSALSNWIEAKLLLRQGNIGRATKLLEQIADKERPEKVYKHWWGEMIWDTHQSIDRVYGELGVLRLNNGNFVGALDAFMKSGYWVDAAYVAERVLRIEELQEYVDQHYPDGSDEMGSSLRYLLARRLIRADQNLGVSNYFPEESRHIYQQFEEHILSARIHENNVYKRAESLMEAARILRWKGMEIASTEVEPDWHYCQEGKYQFKPISNARYNMKVNKIPRRKKNRYPSKQSWLSSIQQYPNKESVPSFPFLLDDEMRRVLKHGPVPERRFQYRYKAVELAWEAASLLPDDTTQTAMILWEAGRWLADRDPQSADVLYKALVWRNPNIPLARYADRLGWFPPADESAKPIIKTIDGDASQPTQ